ncbi:MAG TPA: hypothetical protein VH394_05890 [Thermoanaerobaculia bacterium]|jgi:hypothetical protein|nr:hypothetical protein [Thermoanaerobaculia bacterium]
MSRKARAALQIVLLGFLSVAAFAAPPPSPVGTEIRVSTTPTVSHFHPSVAVFQDGSFVVVWTSTAGARARFFDSQGKPQTGEVPLKVAGVVNQVVADPSGGFFVAWTGPSNPTTNVFVRRFNRNGTPRSKAIRANIPNTSFHRANPVVAVAPDGRFAVAWASEVPVPEFEDVVITNAVGRIFSAKGIPITPEITLYEGSPPSPALDDADNAFPTSLTFAPDGTVSALVELWPSCARTFLVRLPRGSVTPEPRALASFCAGTDNIRSSLAMGKDGSLIAAWNQFEIVAQRFSPNGTPRGEVLDVSDDEGSELDPAVALQAGGSFVIVWTDRDGRDGDGRGLFGRAFTAQGAPRSEEFQINTTTAGDQEDPSISAARKGPVVVVWTQTLGERSEVFARILSAK